VKWLTNPKKLLPGTRMPQFQWGTEQETFPGTPEEQVEAIKDLLMYLKE
jgi:cytochrome c2